jgi:small subunit ribosomal protein S7
MRRKKKENRKIVPDAVHSSVLVTKFTNYLMFSGKKATAERVVWDALEEAKKIKKEDGVRILEQAIKNATPLVEIRPRRIGGATYQVPREVPADRAFAMACKWIIGAARSKKGKPMAKKLSEEFLLAIKNEGSAIKKKLDTHRMAEANRAFAHFAW